MRFRKMRRSERRVWIGDLVRFHGAEAVSIAEDRARFCFRHRDWRGLRHWMSVRVRLSGTSRGQTRAWLSALAALSAIVFP